MRFDFILEKRGIMSRRIPKSINIYLLFTYIFYYIFILYSEFSHSFIQFKTYLIYRIRIIYKTQDFYY